MSGVWGGSNYHFVLQQKGRRFTDVAEVQQESLAALDSISV
jgi:hypothetical protein